MRFRVSFFGLAFLFLGSAVASELPTAEDIDGLAESAKSFASDFKTASRELRFQYEYSGRFLKTADEERLNSLAKQASEQLRSISESQEKIKRRIEAYEGDDWEDRYGETGLWRKLFTGLYLTNIRRLEVDFQIALHSDDAVRKERVHDLLGRIEALGRDYETAYLQFLRAKVLGLMASTDAACKSLARQQYDMLLERSDMRQATAFRVAIERIKLFGADDEDRPAQLTNELAQSDCLDDHELIMSLACLQHRLNMPQAFRKTLSLSAVAERFMGMRILADLDYRLEHDESDLAKTSLFEAELAAQAAWADVPENWANLLRHLSKSSNFQTPLILYVSAIASAEARPAEAVEILLQAAKLQQVEKCERLGIEAPQIAEQAAKLACNAYAAGRLDEHEVVSAFDSSRQICGHWTDEELEYCCAAALMASGQREKGTELLEAIANAPHAKRRCRAMLALITSRITRDHYTDATKRAEVSRDLLYLLHTCIEPNDPQNVRPEAMRIFCGLMLESPENNEAQKIVDILTDMELQKAPELRAFKSKALRYLGRLDEAAECIAEICRADNHEHALEAEQVIIGIIEKFEQLQRRSADPTKLVQNSLTLAQYCEQIASSNRGLIPTDRARLYIAEALLFAEAKEPKDLARVEKLLDDLGDKYKDGKADFLRCKARLFTEQGKFAEAGALWAEVASMEKRRSVRQNQRSWQWWRAKYYELFCFSKMQQTKAQDVVHNIEVLENGFGEIPPLWAERLEMLKQLSSKGDDNLGGL